MMPPLRGSAPEEREAAMSAFRAMLTTDPLSDEAPPIRTHHGHDLTPLLGN